MHLFKAPLEGGTLDFLLYLSLLSTLVASQGSPSSPLPAALSASLIPTAPAEATASASGRERSPVESSSRAGSRESLPVEPESLPAEPENLPLSAAAPLGERYLIKRMGQAFACTSGSNS